MAEAGAPTTPPKPATPAAPPAAAPAAPPVMPMPELPAGTRLYECMWLVDANTGREDFTKVMAGLKELIEKGGGAWINGDKWEERRLAYSIRKKKRGLYIISHFSSAPDNITKIDRNARLSEVVLRHMITVDEDGLLTTPPVRALDEDDFGGGGERRYFGGGDRRRDDRPRPDRSDRGERSGPPGGSAPRA